MFQTFGQLNAQLEMEMDLEDETFVQPAELIGYWNHAVAQAEAHIITLGLRDKYFLTRFAFGTVLGQEAYPLPTNMYANKIKKIIYQNGATFYTLRPLDSKDMFENYTYLNVFSTTDYYRYFIEHDVPGTQNIIIVPAARETTVGNVVTIWYPRRANRYVATDGSDICDLPDICYEFLNMRVRELCYAKETHINAPAAKADREEKEMLMQSVLSGQVDDSEMSILETDLSVYQESS